jgi:hypothetical protein
MTLDERFEKHLESVEKKVDASDTFVWAELSELGALTGLHPDDDLPELIEMYAEETFEE